MLRCVDLILLCCVACVVLCYCIVVLRQVVLVE